MPIGQVSCATCFARSLDMSGFELEIQFPTIGTRLKLAKTVRLSRIAKRRYVASGSFAAAFVPNICVNALSFSMLADMFTAVVTTNTGHMGDTMKWCWHRESVQFAEMYVAPYTPRIRRHSRSMKNLCGRMKSSEKFSRRHGTSFCRPDAFMKMLLSTVQTNGESPRAAPVPARRSFPRRVVNGIAGEDSGMAGVGIATESPGF
mmetsp:Transcript_73459/g.207460  ORF Transcript_73459/g.207460 Transcript_73459/m.207460 type:complete len:204 (+) Transcript_73459:312-923(+)